MERIRKHFYFCEFWSNFSCLSFTLLIKFSECFRQILVFYGFLKSFPELIWFLSISSCTRVRFSSHILLFISWVYYLMVFNLQIRWLQILCVFCRKLLSLLGFSFAYSENYSLFVVFHNLFMILWFFFSLSWSMFKWCIKFYYPSCLVIREILFWYYLDDKNISSLNQDTII